MVGLGLAIVITVGLFAGPTCRGGQSTNPDEEVKPVPVATLAGEVVSLQSVDDHFRQVSSLYLNIDGGAPPEAEAQFYASSLNEQIRAAAQRAIARKRGIKVTKEQILQELDRQLEARLAQARVQLMASGQLKTGATEAEAQAAIAKQLGTDVATWKDAQKDIVEKAYESPTKRADLESPVIGSTLVATIGNGIQISDDQLRKSKEKVVTKRIVFDPFKRKDEDLKAKAEGVLKEIQGGLSFEAAMDKYSDDSAPPKKKKSEATVDLERSTLDFDKKLTPIGSLQPGQMTPVFTLSTGETAIYKVIRVDSKLPDNFENQKADLKKALIQQKAFRQVQDEIEALVKSDDLKWDSEGFRVLYAWLQIQVDDETRSDEKKKLEAIKKLVVEAKKAALDPDSIGGRPANLTWFVTQDAIYDKASADEKKGMAQDWFDAATGVLTIIENVDLRLEVARVALDLKKPEEAAENLARASESNAGASDQALKHFESVEGLLKRLEAAGGKADSVKVIRENQSQWKSDAAETLRSDAELNEDYTATGQTRFAEINAKVQKYREKGILNATQAAEIQKFQEKWKVEKKKADDEAAAERKKEAEEAKKAADANKAKPGTTAPSTSDLLKPAGKTGG